MSAIKDGRIPFELGGKTYHMLFSLNVMDEVEDKIGSIDKLPDAMNGEGRMKVIKWLFTLLLNEGMNEGEEPLTEHQVGKMIHGGNMKAIQTEIYNAFLYGNRGTTDPAALETTEDRDESEDEAGKNTGAGKDE